LINFSFMLLNFKESSYCRHRSGGKPQLLLE
jgi:hypothetical protein